jgi:creatinine amidohydrolase
MRWEALSTKDFAQVARSAPVLMNIAAIEQHGPHLPVDVDACIGQHLVDELDRVMGDRILSLPQIKVCCSAHHMAFAGSLTVSHESFLAYAFDLLSSVVAHGFKTIVVLNSHGGNQAIGQVLIEKLGMAHPDVRFVFMTWWKTASAELRELRESPFGGVNHACEFETALMMHIAPEAVREDLIGGYNHVLPYEWADADMLDSRSASLFRPMDVSSGGTGVVGDPSLGTPEKGRRISDIVVTKIARILEDVSL